LAVAVGVGLGGTGVVTSTSTYRLGRTRRPAGQTPAQYVRQRLDRLQLGSDLTVIRWGQRRIIPLPTSALPEVRELLPAT